MKNYQKGFVVPAIIIVAIIALGGGVYYATTLKKSPKIPVTIKTTEFATSTIVTSSNEKTLLYKDDWGIIFPVPEGWSYISTTTPMIHGRQERVIKIIPDQDKNEFLKPFTAQNTRTIIRPDEFNSEAIYVVEARLPKELISISKDFYSDETLFKAAALNMTGSMGVTDAKTITLFDKGSLRKPLTGFYTSSASSIKTGSSQSIINLLSKDVAGDAVAVSLSYLGRNGKFNAEISRNLINSIDIDTTILKPYFDYQLLIKSGAVRQMGTVGGTMSQENKLKNIFASVRTSAELYFNTSQSYVGYCATDATYKKAKEYVSPVVPSCKDSVGAYAVSAQIEQGRYLCVDSTGQQLVTNSPATGVVCIK